MAKEYRWKTDANIISGGYVNEETGIINGSTDWHTTDVLSGSSSAQYFFRDSDSGQNNNSSRVVVDITETWTASIDARNYLTITIQTTINSIVRDDIRGNPGTAGRSMFVRRENGGAVLWSIQNDPINTAHTLLGSPITLDSYSFTLAPGENLSRGSVYFRSNLYGHDSDPVPSIYVDLMWLGTSFQNILPADYRPGAILKSTNKYEINPPDGAYYSHNRSSGACHVLAVDGGSTWTEMRTIGAPTEMGDPPAVLHDSKWYNQLLIGKE